jgi:tungstate transport system ATP-binding protein
MVYRLSKLTKVYGARTVLNIPKLEIESERIYALLGPNGAGKTTLLNILGFLEPPTTGRIQYRRQSVRYAESDLLQYRKEVIMVDQHPILFTTTVYKNLEFGLKIRGVGQRERERIIDEALDLVGMRSFIKSQAQHLSGGETQRVAIARALALAPRVFLCDEPTASVDIENQNIIINILKQINEDRRITILFTTHDRSQAADLAHETLTLDYGQLVETAWENVFSGFLQPDSDGGYRCVVQDKISFLISPNQTGPGNKSVRLVVDPARIKLIGYPDDACDASRLRGKLVRAAAQNSKIHLVVDIGLFITLLIPRKNYEQFRPLVGEVVDICVPPEAVQVLYP